ncbi:hypothetical protein MUK70_12845 [Dyadobacter chenwenxiniae]|uniref:Uncharacterized protein n=1 Tax=Dyadobacter chenwenxiniae TaxID=2906456 RepID=A0A9X1TCI7_9BACT|nr:hypothetical protein [Dyadobacter chenwenxiniae]MCF0060132.1 hypothetical protein [Dyadobacter chenwenxiniae]UON85869.1 hypothetical protein MUK70_12845 [Dyadobacter chenwenxiniae]
MKELFDSILDTISNSFREIKSIPNAEESKMLGYRYIQLLIQTLSPHTITLEFAPNTPSGPLLVIKIYPAINSIERHLFKPLPEFSNAQSQYSHEKKSIFIIGDIPNSSQYKVSLTSLAPESSSDKEMSEHEIISEIMALLSESEFGRDF